MQERVWWGRKKGESVWITVIMFATCFSFVLFFLSLLFLDLSMETVGKLILSRPEVLHWSSRPQTVNFIFFSIFLSLLLLSLAKRFLDYFLQSTRTTFQYTRARSCCLCSLECLRLVPALCCVHVRTIPVYSSYINLGFFVFYSSYSSFFLLIVTFDS